MVDSTREWISQVLPSKLRQISTLHTICNYFLTGIFSHNVQIDFHVIMLFDARNITLDASMGIYKLLDFSQCYETYLKHFVSLSDLLWIYHSFNFFFLYHKLCMQL